MHNTNTTTEADGQTKTPWTLDVDGWRIIKPRTNPHHCDEVILELPDPLDDETRAAVILDARRAVASVNQCGDMPLEVLEFGSVRAAFSLFIEMEDYLREIRAENLDGSETNLGELLEQARATRLALRLGNAATTIQDTGRPFVGWEHPRYEEWRSEAEAGNTLLGLADWLEHNPEADRPAIEGGEFQFHDDLIDEGIALLEAQRAELAEGISLTSDSEYDREGRRVLAEWDAANGPKLDALKARKAELNN